jgi:glycosyltransferase involved in cell wall biosynthesis
MSHEGDMSSIGISIVVPVFNEEESVSLLYNNIKTVSETLEVPYEIVFVDDGSHDQTFSILTTIHQHDPHVKVVHFRKNFGQTAAMAAGFQYAHGAVIISMDGDLQNDPADIPRLLARLDEGYDVVCGWRKDRKDKLVSRKIPSRIANWLIGKISGVAIHDNGCSLKAYRAEVIKRVALYSEFHRFIPAMSTLSGARIAEIVVDHHARQFGRSKYGISRAWRVFLDLFLVKMLTGFAARPALWFGLLSLPGLLWSVACVVSLWVAGISGMIMPAIAFLSCALSGHLLALGILGEMVLKVGDFRPSHMLRNIQTKMVKEG